MRILLFSISLIPANTATSCILIGLIRIVRLSIHRFLNEVRYIKNDRLALARSASGETGLPVQLVRIGNEFRFDGSFNVIYKPNHRLGKTSTTLSIILLTNDRNKKAYRETGQS